MKVQGIYTNKYFKNSLEFAKKNGALFAGTASLVMSTIARPIAIMATPNTDKENKKYACAKSFSSSAVGYFLMLLASVPVAKAIKNINQSPLKYLKKSTVEFFKKENKNLAKSSTYNFATQLFTLGVGFVIAVPKSIMTCALIPPLMSKIFPKRDSDKKDDINNSKIQKKSPSPSFTGSQSVVIEGLSKGIGKIMDTQSLQKLSEKFHNTNFEQHIMSLTDVLITASFMQQTKHNKKIEEARKKPLMYNSAISTGLCLTGGYAVNSLVKKKFDKFVEKFTEANKNSPKLADYIEGLKIAKTTLILGGIYYIVIPIISTFLADRVDRKNTKLFS